MMLKQVFVTVVVALVGLVSAQDTTPSVCAVGCVNGVFVNAANMGCANGDMLCVCNKTDSLQGGIHDCIVNACAPDGPDVQIPLAQAYATEQCAKAAAATSSPPPAPTTSTAAPAPEPTPAEVTSSTTSTAASSTSTPVSSAESTPQSTATSTSATSTPVTDTSAVSTATASPTTSSSVSDNTSTTTQAVSSTTSASTSISSSSSTTSGTSAPAATSSTSPAPAGVSVAVKAGIGAGVGAAVLAALIIAVCVCLRRRQRKKTAKPVRNYKISEPMASSGSSPQFASDIGRAETGLPRPIVTTHPAHLDTPGMPTSPTSVYSNGSDLESHARRYEDMPPRTQPRTMI